MSALIPEYATEAGTAAYRERLGGRAAAGHFREHQGLWFSSLGIGTYLGGEDAATDRLYRDAVLRALELGINVIDTAINYRAQRSERAIGEALRLAFERGIARREEIVVATKGGFLPFDGGPRRTPAPTSRRPSSVPGSSAGRSSWPGATA